MSEAIKDNDTSDGEKGQKHVTPDIDIIQK